MFGWQDMNNDSLRSISEEGKLKLPDFTNPTIGEELLLIPFEDHLCICGIKQLGRRYDRLVKKTFIVHHLFL